MNKYHIYPQIDEMSIYPADSKVADDKNRLVKMINELMSRDIGLTFEEKVDFLAKNKFSFAIYMTRDEYDDEGNFKRSDIVKYFSSSSVSTGTINVSTI